MVVGSEPGVVVSEKIFPAPECAIVFVVSCLAFSFRFVSFHRWSLAVHLSLSKSKNYE